MNEHKIAFISCVNEAQTYEECLAYIRHLAVPAGWEMETLAVEGAASMAAGYHYAMCQSDAKYKVYLHQDVCLCHKEILLELVQLFQREPQIGLIGLAGCRRLPSSSLWWEGEDVYENLAQVVAPESLKVFQQGGDECPLARSGCS